MDGSVNNQAFTAFQWILAIMLTLGCIHYLWLIWEDRYGQNALVSGYSEGFSNPNGITDSDKSSTIYFENDELFDDFYASVYDNITMGVSRVQTEVGIMIHEWT